MGRIKEQEPRGARRSPEVAQVSFVASCLWQTHGIYYQFKQLGGSACDDV